MALKLNEARQGLDAHDNRTVFGWQLTLRTKAMQFESNRLTKNLDLKLWNPTQDENLFPQKTATPPA